MKKPLTTTEPAAYELINANGQSDVVLVCDHASNRIPSQLHTLGVRAQEMNSHIAWDIGALRVARELSARLDAPLVFSNYSRLVIDCNRFPDAADFIAVSSAGIEIPGNQGISVQEALSRRQHLFDPYHSAIDGLLQARADRATLLLSIHSFTPVMQGIERPWPIGVCYHEGELWGGRWLNALQAELTAKVGDNEPYVIESDVDYTITEHAQNHRIPAIMLEIRQDEIGSQAGAKRWAEIIGNGWGKLAKQGAINERAI